MKMSEKEKPKINQTKNIPKDGQVIMAIMKEMGINEYEPKTIVQLTEFVYRYATSVLEEARIYANNSKKKVLDVDDVRLALQLTNESSFTTPPPREVLLECAHVKNYGPLQVVKPYCGLRLPPDRYCLSACNYSLKNTVQKKVKPSYTVTGASTGIKITTKPNVSYIKRTTPVGVTKQTITIAKPKIANVNVQNIYQQQKTVKPKIQITQNIQLASANGPTMAMEIVENTLKRKREDDDVEDINH